MREIQKIGFAGGEYNVNMNNDNKWEMRTPFVILNDVSGVDGAIQQPVFDKCIGNAVVFDVGMLWWPGMRPDIMLFVLCWCRLSLCECFWRLRWTFLLLNVLYTFRNLVRLWYWIAVNDSQLFLIQNNQFDDKLHCHIFLSEK